MRSGVPIAPRSIPEQQPAPPPASTNVEPEQAPPASDDDLNAAINDALEQPAQNVPAPRSVTPSLREGARTNARPQAPEPVASEIAGGIAPSPNAIETAPSAPLEELGAAPLGPAQAPPALEATQNNQPPSSPFPIWIWALVALVLGIIAGCAAFVLRARKAQAVETAPVLARDTLSSAPQAPIKPAETPAPPPLHEETHPVQNQPRIDVDVEIVSATRSLMMFTFVCRVTLANRSDHAVRDIALSHHLVCAQKGMAGAKDAVTDAGGCIVERIGPNQSHTSELQLTLPLSDIEVIRQGNKPLCIPMAFITVSPNETEPLMKSFIIGTPSLASSERLHPIALDTPPGGIPGLRAHEVKTERKSAQAA
ncbi:MAG: hypothetical protein AAGK17_02640 [Pseudomonadota bacterium]